MKLLYYLVIIVAVGYNMGVFCDTKCSGKDDSTTAIAGQPFILHYFGFDGPRTSIEYLLTKDGVPLEKDNSRIFYYNGRVYFSEVSDSDAGVYQLLAYNNETKYNKTIKLCGKKSYHTVCRYICMLLLLCWYCGLWLLAVFTLHQCALSMINACV